jgi:hypothetical protein
MSCHVMWGMTCFSIDADGEAACSKNMFVEHSGTSTYSLARHEVIEALLWEHLDEPLGARSEEGPRSRPYSTTCAGAVMPIT